MSLDPEISLSPRNAFASNVLFPPYPGIFGGLSIYGGFSADNALFGAEPRSFQTQYSADKALVAYDPVPTTDTSLGNWLDYARHCSVRVAFAGRNIPSNRQYLFLFRFEPLAGTNVVPPTVQFFFGLDFLEQRELAGPTDDVAILVDAPPVDYQRAIVARLASDSGAITGFYFHGVDIYLI